MEYIDTHAHNEIQFSTTNHKTKQNKKHLAQTLTTMIKFTVSLNHHIQKKT